MKRFEKPILVTRPYLPPLEEFKRGLEEVWSNQWRMRLVFLITEYTEELGC